MAAGLPNDDRMRLFDAVLTGQAGEAEVRAVEELLEKDAAARAQFALVSQLDVDLRFAFRTGAVSAVAESPATLKETASRGSTAVLPNRASSTGRRLAVGLLALAAAIAVVVASLPLFSVSEPLPARLACKVPGSKPPAPVATITSFDRVEWDGAAYELGGLLREGETFRLARGEARISAGFGAEIAAQGPCSLTFVEVDRVRLDYGDVAVHVAEWATGFTVVTDAMQVVDLGTTFTVSAKKGAGAQTEVLKGLVRVHPKVSEDGRRGVLVAEGGAFTVDPQGRPSALIEPPAELFENLDLDSLVPYRPIQLANTGVGWQGVRLSEGDEDSNWRVVAGPDGDFDGSQFAVVCKPDERYLQNDPEHSQWVSTPSWRTAKPNSVYTFETAFDLTGYDLSTIQLFGRFLADNGIQAVRVNGQPVKVESWIDNESFQQFDHGQFRFVNVTEGLVEGRNTIEIDVWNGIFQEPADSRDKPNPMALRVEWFAFGRQAK